MNIIEAAKAMNRGKSVRRAAWKEWARIGVFAGVCIETRKRYCSRPHKFVPEPEDLLADDWEIVE